MCTKVRKGAGQEGVLEEVVCLFAFASASGSNQYGTEKGEGKGGRVVHFFLVYVVIWFGCASGISEAGCVKERERE